MTSIEPFNGDFVVNPGILVRFIFVAFLVVHVKVTEPPFSTLFMEDSKVTSGFKTFVGSGIGSGLEETISSILVEVTGFIPSRTSLIL